MLLVMLVSIPLIGALAVFAMRTLPFVRTVAPGMLSRLPTLSTRSPIGAKRPGRPATVVAFVVAVTAIVAFLLGIAPVRRRIRRQPTARRRGGVLTHVPRVTIVTILPPVLRSAGLGALAVVKFATRVGDARPARRSVEAVMVAALLPATIVAVPAASATRFQRHGARRSDVPGRADAVSAGVMVRVGRVEEWRVPWSVHGVDRVERGGVGGAVAAHAAIVAAEGTGGEGGRGRG